MRAARNAVVNLLLPLTGMLVAFAGVIYLDAMMPTLLVVLVGILIVEAGVWNLASPILPSSRVYLELRDEVDQFIDQVRVLNAAASEARSGGPPEAWDRYEQALADMHLSVNRMGTLAGKEAHMDETRPPETQ